MTGAARLIYNPNAGPLELQTTIEKIARDWQQNGWSITLAPTTHAGHARKLAEAAAADGIDLVFAAGGDGTLNEVANGILHSQTVMAPLPIGTANSFAKELGLPRPTFWNPGQLLASSAALRNGLVQQMDVGRNNERAWLFWSGVGVDSYLVDQVEPRPRWSKKLGPAGYFLQSLPLLPGFRGFTGTVTLDHAITVSDTFVLVIISNCRLYGGEFLLSPDARLDDGELEVWFFRGSHVGTAMKYAAAMFIERHTSDPNVTMRRARHVKIETQSTAPLHMDGEKAGETPYTCELVPSAVQILVPDSTPADLFTRPGVPLKQFMATSKR